jgi:hypothetical protein
MNDEVQQVQSNIVPINPLALWREERFTDLENGEIKCFIPITISNVRDMERKMRFVSSIKLSFRGRMMEVNFELPADTLATALAVWPATAEKAGQDAHRQLEEQARTQKLVVPQHARLDRPN